MEKYRIHCERLSSSLDDCEKKLTGFEIQEDYHAADLRKVSRTIGELGFGILKVSVFINALSNVHSCLRLLMSLKCQKLHDLIYGQPLDLNWFVAVAL